MKHLLNRLSAFIVMQLCVSVVCTLMFTSCSDDGICSPSSAAFPTNELVDNTVNPGDDFYSYCNGSWVSSHSLEPGQLSTQFWMDDMYSENAFAQKLMLSSDPVVKKLMMDIDNQQLTAEYMASLQQKTCRQLEEIDQLTTLEDVIGKVAKMGMKGYNTGIRLCSQPVERRIQTVADVLIPAAASAEAWQKMTGCTDAEANEKAAACGDVLNDLTAHVGIAIRNKPYAGNEVVEGRKLLAKAIGVPVERLIYGETIDQDDFMKACVNEGRIEDWKMVLKNSIVEFNYKWTYATKESLAAFLTEPMHPFAYRITKLYSETYKDDIMRDFVYEMVENIRASFIEMIQSNTWLSEETKQAALDKSYKLDSFVGYPDTWQQERMGSVPTGTTLLEDMEQAGEEWSAIINASRTDNPSRDDTWYSLTQASVAPYNFNAMNMTEMNALYMYMPTLLPNTCRKNVPASYNYAMVGAIAGHEFGHGFDTAGYQFGSNGEWNDWWTPQDKQSFLARAKQLADYNSQYVPYPEKYPDLHSRGDQTTVEDLADLNGLNAAFRAMVKYYQGQGASDAEMLQAKREFFLAYANIWAGVFSEEYIIRRIETNIHSIAPIRVNGIVRHMDEWYDAYGIKPTDKLYLAPDQRVRIWND